MNPDEVGYFTYKVSDDKTLNCDYFFSYKGVNKGSGCINLYIRPNDPENPSLNHVNITVLESILEKPQEEIERVAMSELALLYIDKKHANDS